MELPPQITFHRLERSDAIAAHVRERAQKLDCISTEFTCRVALPPQAIDAVVFEFYGEPASRTET